MRNLADAVAEEAARHPGAVIETFATDGHRIGLKPILRRVWAPRRQRPIAPCHHRFEWLHVTSVVSPATNSPSGPGWYSNKRIEPSASSYRRTNRTRSGKPKNVLLRPI